MTQDHTIVLHTYTDITEAYILKRHKTIKTDWLSALCEDAIVQGFTSANGNLYRTNRDDQINMMGQKDYLDANPTVTTVMWKTENKGYVSHTKAEWLAVYAEAFSHKRDKLLKYNDLKTKVTNATTDEAVVAVQW